MPEVNDFAVEAQLPPRFPVRWKWTMLVGLAVAAAVFVLVIILLDMERDAWLKNQEVQAQVLVDRLGDELKIPMLAGSKTEVDVMLQGFARKVPTVLGVYLRYTSGDLQKYGNVSTMGELKPLKVEGVHTRRLATPSLWYGRAVEYAGTHIGMIAVHYSEDEWKQQAGRLVARIVWAALVVIVLSSMLVYWVAGRISRPLELLAVGARQVASGDYRVELPVQGNDELSDAMSQFNQMVHELAHKEEIRDVFGRYLNPKLVSDVFEGAVTEAENRRQEVTVLFADMVGFTAFSESTEPEEIVDVLNKHFEVFHRIIDYYGGHVDKYIGDAVMAVFNHPNEDEEHVRHAAMAGLAMTMACSKLGVLRQNGEPISFRVGLNRGQAIVGNIGAAERLEYTVIGDTVNVASRMGGLGSGGEVVLSHSTFMHVGDGFSFDEMGAREVKGVSLPIRCGRIKAADENEQRNIAHAVALAFDLTLPSDVRHIIGDV